RLARPRRLSRCGRTGRVGETAGGVRPGADPAAGPRPRSCHLQATLPGRPSGAGHARPGELLARRLRRGAQGPARPIPEALLAGESARGGADARRATQALIAAAVEPALQPVIDGQRADRKSTRLNSSHLGISYAVFGLKKK